MKVVGSHGYKYIYIFTYVKGYIYLHKNIFFPADFFSSDSTFKQSTNYFFRSVPLIRRQVGRTHGVVEAMSLERVEFSTEWKWKICSPCIECLEHVFIFLLGGLVGFLLGWIIWSRKGNDFFWVESHVFLLGIAISTVRVIHDDHV